MQQDKKNQQEIKDRLHQFELLALLRLLDHLGYRQIWYQSSEQLISEPQILEDIDFIDLSNKEQPDSQQALVKLSLNIGMLGPQSPLPSYFLKLRETLLQNDQDFIQFIGFFDHILIEQLLRQLFPELALFNGQTWANWQQQSLLLTNLKAVRNVHMIFSAIFPEYQINCDWQQQRQSLSLCDRHVAELGIFVIGTTRGLGGVAAKHDKILRVRLSQQAWPLSLPELRHRLEQLIFPLFAPLWLPIEVYLVGQLQPLQLAANEQPNWQDPVLGYHPLQPRAMPGLQRLFTGNTYQAVCD